MFVQALAAYADTYLSDQLADEAFEEKPVGSLIELGPDGTFLNVTQHNISVQQGKKTVSKAALLSIPKSPVSRVAGLHPLLAADDVKYVLGAGPWTSQGEQENARERHEAFASLIGRAAEATRDEALESCLAFYRRADQVEAARQAMGGAKPGSIVALSVNGPVVKRAAVQRFWRDHFRTAAGSRVAEGGVAECLISGRTGPIARTHDKIKGLASLGGQAAGVSLMSFDKESFRSYGWEQNANSPVAPDRAMAYVLALNDLLRHGNGHRRDWAGAGFIFWTKEKTEFDPMSNVDQPDPAQVQRLLRFDPLADPDPNMFYMAGVAGNGGRMLIRYWVAETLTEVKANLRDWFKGLQVADVFTGKISDPPKLWQLLRAIHREGEPPSDRIVALLRRAIEGSRQPLGYRMLSAALNRLRASGENRRDAARMGLIRLCLNDLDSRNGGGTCMSELLDTGQRHPAYLSGRLLAVYESLQYAVNKSEVGQTVADRYYTMASTYPALAFPELADLGQKHLRKLRRDNPGAKVRLEQEIGRLHLEIEEASGYRFPRQLDLEGQGRFALGYHHQRAHQMAQAQAKKSKNELSQLQADEERATGERENI